jgi:hypothetical protein
MTQHRLDPHVIIFKKQKKISIFSNFKIQFFEMIFRSIFRTPNVINFFDIIIPYFSIFINHEFFIVTLTYEFECLEV